MAVLPLSERVAGAPISWGVCEAPGWGIELAPDRVLDEMRDVGLRATELGPAGYLGTEPAGVAEFVRAHDLDLIGGFVPVVMHTDDDLDLSDAAAAMAVLAAGGAQMVVLAADSAGDGYELKDELDEAQWSTLLQNLTRLQQLAAEHGLTPTLHPHVGTAIEDRATVERLLTDSNVPLCLDTGHLFIGGTDPLTLCEKAPQRVAHVHLKDVDRTLAHAVETRQRSYLEAVSDGLYRPLGEGDVDIAGCVRALENAGYQGWYVLEQDCRVPTEPEPGSGPITDVRASIDYLRSLGS